MLLLSLFTGLFVIYKEKGTGQNSFRLLIVRVSLALTLLGLIAFGIAKGYLGSKAPWDRFHVDPQTMNQNK